MSLQQHRSFISPAVHTSNQKPPWGGSQVARLSGKPLPLERPVETLIRVEWVAEVSKTD
ncbi:hypothetical protein F441_22787 [Phytophthora nicotianae CJ01A1]|uniref:Uncharacterized protein n=2 Tax=Phytophthora nicotianae TaxID=4792 RepID=W2VNF6_PHYNI|nr:hypothetical protein F444_23230 [Phytophthora nicotianae P1976]ETO99789.1 hypothetical protein F441_22787 [Phytophthora nicotianae CJ01A1]